MKKLAAMLCMSVMTTGVFAQGLINFGNSPTTLISTQVPGQAAQTMAGASGSFLFGLLISPAATGPFTFAGIYGTNLVNASGGRLSGGNGVAVNGWQPGATMFYELVGWASTAGATFNAAWVKADGTTGTRPVDFFGISAQGSGIAGGGPNSLPPLPLFQGASGIPTGFTLTPVPEPTSMALAGLGAAALLIFRRRK
jgi:hypothetical protein